MRRQLLPGPAAANISHPRAARHAGPPAPRFGLFHNDGQLAGLAQRHPVVLLRLRFAQILLLQEHQRAALGQILQQGLKSLLPFGSARQAFGLAEQDQAARSQEGMRAAGLLHGLQIEALGREMLHVEAGAVRIAELVTQQLDRFCDGEGVVAVEKVDRGQATGHVSRG